MQLPITVVSATGLSFATLYAPAVVMGTARRVAFCLDCSRTLHLPKVADRTGV